MNRIPRVEVRVQAFIVADVVVEGEHSLVVVFVGPQHDVHVVIVEQRFDAVP